MIGCVGRVGWGDACSCDLLLSCHAENYVGAEGARVLAEPLGKLTLLRELNLGGVCTLAGLFRDWTCWSHGMGRCMQLRFAS